MSDIQVTLEFLQTEIVRLSEAIDRIDPRLTRRGNFYEDQAADNEGSLVTYSEYVKRIMRLVDEYADLRAGPYGRNVYDESRRRNIMDALAAAEKSIRS